MSFRLLAQVPVATVANNMTTNPIDTGAWTQLLASLPRACCAVEISNNSGSTIQISTGAAGQEAANAIPYTVLPGGSPILLPIEIMKGARISAKAVDADATSGYFTMNFFG
jgi:hypothetical protein